MNKNELKQTAGLLKDVGIHFVLEGRQQLSKGMMKAAEGVVIAAEKVDTTPAQKAFIKGVHAKLEARKNIKDAKFTVLQGAKA